MLAVTRYALLGRHRRRRRLRVYCCITHNQVALRVAVDTALPSLCSPYDRVWKWILSSPPVTSRELPRTLGLDDSPDELLCPRRRFVIAVDISTLRPPSELISQKRVNSIDDAAIKFPREFLSSSLVPSGSLFRPLCQSARLRPASPVDAADSIFVARRECSAVSSCPEQLAPPTPSRPPRGRSASCRPARVPISTLPRSATAWR